MGQWFYAAAAVAILLAWVIYLVALNKRGKRMETSGIGEKAQCNHKMTRAEMLTELDKKLDTGADSIKSNLAMLMILLTISGHDDDIERKVRAKIIAKQVKGILESFTEDLEKMLKEWGPKQ